MFDTLAYKLSVLYKNFYAYASARLHPFGLHNAWIFFILYVGKHADCTPAELTKSLHVDWGYSQRCITKLVEEGFLTKEKAGRSYHLNLTGKGQQVYQESHQLFFDWDRLRLSGRYAAWRHRHRTDEKMPVFQFGGWPSGAHLASYLYQDLSISAILWLQREDPVGYRYCEYDQVPQKTLERRAARQLEQYRQSEGVFTMSRWLSEFLIRECGLPREKVHAVGGGINVDAAGIRPGSKEGRRILFVGRNFVRKGGPLVVQAFTILRKKYLWSAELYLAGAKESDIRDALRERQIRVEEVDWQKIHLLGDLGSEKLTDYYNLCDVFCMPSYFEAYGLVFAEALTYGLPCIGRDKFAMSEFIEDGCTGRLISGEDAEELALDLWEVLQDPKYREEVERRREWYLREYSWDKVAQRICSVMEKNERDKDQYRSAGV